MFDGLPSSAIIWRARPRSARAAATLNTEIAVSSDSVGAPPSRVIRKAPIEGASAAVMLIGRASRPEITGASKGPNR